MRYLTLNFFVKDKVLYSKNGDDKVLRNVFNKLRGVTSQMDVIYVLMSA
jgi:hypothetical protein